MNKDREMRKLLGQVMKAGDELEALTFELHVSTEHKKLSQRSAKAIKRWADACRKVAARFPIQKP